MLLARNCRPRKYGPWSVMIASRLASFELSSTCSVLGLTSSRSTVQAVDNSAYEPEIRKLRAASRLPPAPLFSSRTVGSPSPNGRSHAASATSAAAARAALPSASTTLLCNGRHVRPPTPPCPNPHSPLPPHTRPPPRH